MKRVSLVAAALVALSGCTGPHGQIDYAKTAILGAGVGGAAFLLGGALSDQSGRGYKREYRQSSGYPQQSYGGSGYYPQQPYTGGYGQPRSFSGFGF